MSGAVLRRWRAKSALGEALGGGERSWSGVEMESVGETWLVGWWVRYFTGDLVAGTRQGKMII